MHLTPSQIRTSCRAHCTFGGGNDKTAHDELLGAMCSRLSLLPDVREGVVAEARARLRVTGPPSAELLADMLVEELNLVDVR